MVISGLIISGGNESHHPADQRTDKTYLKRCLIWTLMPDTRAGPEMRSMYWVIISTKCPENWKVRSAELKSANNKLQKDIEDKIKIDEMRKEFLDNVSHELKTPDRADPGICGRTERKYFR